MIKSMKNSEHKGHIEVTNIKVRFWNNEVGATLSRSAGPTSTSYHINAR